MSHSPTGQQSSEVQTQAIKYGEREIAEGQLITFPNPRIGPSLRYQYNLAGIYL